VSLQYVPISVHLAGRTVHLRRASNGCGKQSVMILLKSHYYFYCTVSVLMTEYLALQQDSSGGMIRLPSRMIHIDKVCPIKKAGTAGIAATAGSLPTESPGRNFEAKHGEQVINVVQVSQSPKQSQAVSYSLSHPSLKEVSFKKQLFSNTFIQLTIFFVISSFWANFIIGNITMHLFQCLHYSLLFTELF
jgi:hypothetical protein